MKEQTKQTGIWEMYSLFLNMHYRHGKKCGFITASQVDTGKVAGEWALFWGVGVFRSSAIREQALNKSYDRGNYIPSLPLPPFKDMHAFGG